MTITQLNFDLGCNRKQNENTAMNSTNCIFTVGNPIMTMNIFTSITWTPVLIHESQLTPRSLFVHFFFHTFSMRQSINKWSLHFIIIYFESNPTFFIEITNKHKDNFLITFKSSVWITSNLMAYSILLLNRRKYIENTRTKNLIRSIE